MVVAPDVEPNGGLRLFQVTVIESGPAEVSTLVGLGIAASFTNPSVPLSAGADALGDTDNEKDNPLSVTPLSSVRVTGILATAPGTAVADAGVAVPTGGVI